MEELIKQFLEAFKGTAGKPISAQELRSDPMFSEEITIDEFSDMHIKRRLSVDKWEVSTVEVIERYRIDIPKP